MDMQVSPDGASSLVLSVEGLAKTFRHAPSRPHSCRPLPTSISIFMPANSFCCKGDNGAGKSTLLRTLYRSLPAGRGHAFYHTREGIIDLARRGRCRYRAFCAGRRSASSPSSCNARPRVAAEELVAEPLVLAGRDHGEALTEARHWLSSFGVKQPLWRAYPSTFSGGEQQKVNLARALILPQRLLLLDEPTASLEPAARAALVARLTELKAQGVAMIGVFHHPGDVAGLVDREIHLETTIRSMIRKWNRFSEKIMLNRARENICG